jgi:hypothetical protein
MYCGNLVMRFVSRSHWCIASHISFFHFKRPHSESLSTSRQFSRVSSVCFHVWTGLCGLCWINRLCGGCWFVVTISSSGFREAHNVEINRGVILYVCLCGLFLHKFPWFLVNMFSFRSANCKIRTIHCIKVNNQY